MAPINQLIIDHQSVTSVILPSQQDFLLWGGTSFPSSLTRCQLSLRISSFLMLPSIYRAATFVMYPRRALGDITSVNDVAFSSEVCFHSRSPLAVFVSVCCGFWGLLFVAKTFCSYTPPLVLVIFRIYGIDSPPLPSFFSSCRWRLQGVCTGSSLRYGLRVFFPRWCSKACVQGLHFPFLSFTPLYLSSNLYNMA